MKLQESGEMYLKTILWLSLQQPVVHSIDISEYMGSGTSRSTRTSPSR